MTNLRTKINNEVRNLTVTELEQYYGSPDKWLWVEYTILDTLGIPATDATVEHAERALEKRIAVEAG